MVQSCVKKNHSHSGEKLPSLTCFLSWKFCFPSASLHIFRNLSAKEFYDL